MKKQLETTWIGGKPTTVIDIVAVGFRNQSIRPF